MTGSVSSDTVIQIDDAKVRRIIRVPKKYTDKFKNRPSAYAKGRNRSKILLKNASLFNKIIERIARICLYQKGL